MENKLILKNFLSYGIGSFFTLLLGFITNPIITRSISPLEYGKYSMFTLFTSIAILIIVFGLDQSFVRFFYEEEEITRGKLLLYCINIALLINLILTIILIILYKPITSYLFQKESIEFIVLIILNNFIMLFNRYAFLIVRMQQKGKLYSFLQVLQKLIFIIVFIALLSPLDKDLRVLMYATIITNLIITVIAICYEMKFWRNSIRIKKSHISSKTDILKFGTPLIFTSLITWMFQSVDRVFINKYSNYEELGIYSAAFTIIVLLNVVQTTFTTFWVPVAYEKYKNDKKCKEFFAFINRIVTACMFYIGVLLIFFKDVLVYLLGREYREAAFIMPFLIFMPLMYTVSETTVLGINFKNKSKYHIFIALFSCLLSIVLNFFLVPILGAKGAAISTGISYVVFFTLRTIISKIIYKMDYGLFRFYICTFFISILAFYSCFNKFDLIILILSLLNLLIITICYWNVIKTSCHKVLLYIIK